MLALGKQKGKGDSDNVSFFRSLKGKLMIFFVIVGVLPALIIGLVSYTKASGSMSDEAMAKLQAMQANKKAQIENYFTTMEGKLHVIKDNPFVQEKLAEIDGAFMAAGDSIDSDEWRAMATEYDPIFADICNDLGWADIVLMCPEGSIVYTKNKEADLGLFVDQEPLRSTSFGEAFRELQSSGGEVAFGDFQPYEPSNGEPTAFMVAKMTDGGEVIGHVAYKLPLTEVNAIMHLRDGMGTTGETYLVGPDKLMRSDSYLDPTGHSVAASFAGTVAANGVDTVATQKALAGQSGAEIITDYNGDSALSVYSPVDVGGTQWAVIAEIDQAEAMAAPNSMKNIFIIVLVSCIVAILIIAFFISRMIANPLIEMVPVAAGVAEGDLDQKIDVKSKDEVGLVGRAFSNVIDYMKEMAGAAQKIADGDLTANVEPKSEKDALGNAFSSMTNNLRGLIGQVTENSTQLASASEQLATAANQAGEASQQVASTSQQMARSAQDQSSSAQESSTGVAQLSQVVTQIASGAQEQASGVQKAVKAIGEVSTASEQVAGNAAAASEGSQSAAEAARNGADLAKQTVQGMEKIRNTVDVASERLTELGARSAEIGKIVAVIDDIAAQTNLLALNAAIEAARAGEQGRGFAVVSDEVRKLAERTATATKEIADLITNVQKGVEQAVKAMEEGQGEVQSGYKLAGEAGDALDTILQAAANVNEQIGQISAKAQQVSASTSELVQVIDSVGSVTEQNTASTEQMSASATQVSKSIESVAGVAEENSAATQQVSASAEEMSAQVEEIIASSDSLKKMAEELQRGVKQFKL